MPSPAFRGRPRRRDGRIVDERIVDERRVTAGAVIESIVDELVVIGGLRVARPAIDVAIAGVVAVRRLVVVLSVVVSEQREPQQCPECDHRRHDEAATHERRDRVADPWKSRAGFPHLVADHVGGDVAAGVGVALHLDLPSVAVERRDRHDAVGDESVGEVAVQRHHVADLELGGVGPGGDEEVAGVDGGFHRSGDHDERLDEAGGGGEPDEAGQDAEAGADPECDAAECAQEAEHGAGRSSRSRPR